jgi:alkaline phosphatase D
MSASTAPGTSLDAGDDDAASLSRRAFVGAGVAAGLSALVGAPRRWSPAEGAPALVPAERLRPALPSGVQTGDVLPDRAILWSRTDRPARLAVEWATRADFRDARRVRGPVARAEAAFTAHLDLRALPPGETIFYRARFESLAHPGTWSAPLAGCFRTPPPADAARPPTRGVRVAWSGDMVGQGWGIDEARGGLRIYDAIRRTDPDVFVHSGDNVYADGPLAAEVPLDDGTVWRNLVTEAKHKVAESLDEFRGNFAYHLLDAHARRFHAAVPVVAQWDDHEVVNNWYHGLVLEDDPRYTERRVDVLAERAARALFEFLPIRRDPVAPRRIYRRFAHGPLLELFVVDLRSHRGANSPNRQPTRSGATAILGEAQRAWLADALARSRATWKVVASDMPIGLVVPDRARDGRPTYEAVANDEPGPPLGRELEIAEPARRPAAGARAQRRLDHGRRALRGRAPLQPGARRLHRVRPVLGVRRRADARRDVRAQRARRDVRPRGALHERGAAPQPAAERRAAVLRHPRRGRADARAHRRAPRRRRPAPLVRRSRARRPRARRHLDTGRLGTTPFVGAQAGGADRDWRARRVDTAPRVAARARPPTRLRA